MKGTFVTDKHNKKSSKGTVSVVDAAVAYIARRERTECEVRIKLYELGYSQDDIDNAVKELYDTLLLNDEVYANEFVQSKLAVRPISKKVLKLKLKNHKLPDSLIEEALSCVDDDTEYRNALSEANTFVFSHIREDMDNEKKRKEIARLTRRLLSHGYNYDMTRRAVKEALSEDISDYD